MTAAEAGAEAALESGAAVFLDTSLIVAATVEVHPSHDAAADTIERLMSQDARLFISPQICRELLVVLTRHPEVSLIAIDG